MTTPRFLVAALVSALCTSFASARAQANGPAWPPSGTEWVHAVGPESSEGSEQIAWQFFADGAVRFTFSSDYRDRFEGAWAVASASDTSTMLLVASAASRIHHAISVRELQDGDAVEIAGQRFTAGERAAPESAPPVRSADREAVAPPFGDGFALWRALRDSRWRRAEGDSPLEAARYDFEADGSYTARAADGCAYSGTWSVFSSGTPKDTLRLDVPAHDCDPRGRRGRFLRELSAHLEGTALRLDETLYAPLRDPA